jgi:hypothetical protein
MEYFVASANFEIAKDWIVKQQNTLGTLFGWNLQS